MSQQGEGNDAFSWDTQAWMNSPNDSSDNSHGDKEISMSKPTEEESGKKQEEVVVKGGKGKGKKSKGETSNPKKHIYTERERRKKMKTMFRSLQSMVPNVTDKTNKITTCDETISYIKRLEGTLHKLEKLKLERLLGIDGQPSNSLKRHDPSVASNTKLGMLSTRESFMADQVASLNNTTTNNNNSSIAKSSTASASHQLPAPIGIFSSPDVVLNVIGNDAVYSVRAPKKTGVFAEICCILEKYKMEVVTSNISSKGDERIYVIQAHLADGAYNEYQGVINVEDIYNQAGAEMIQWVSS